LLQQYPNMYPLILIWKESDIWVVVLMVLGVIQLSFV